MNLVLFNYDSLGFIFAGLVSALLVFVFMKEKNQNSKSKALLLFFIIWLSYYTINALKSFIYHPNSVLLDLSAHIIILSLVPLLSFVYNSPSLIFSKEHKIAIIIASISGFSLICFSAYYYFKQGTVYNFMDMVFKVNEPNHFKLYYVYYVIILVTWITIVCIRQMIIIGIGKSKILFHFGILTLLPIIFAFLRLPEHDESINRRQYNQYFIFGTIIWVFSYMLVYINHTKRTFSFILKVSLIFMITILITIMSMSFIVFPLIEDKYQDTKKAEIELIKLSIQNNKYTFPEDLGYIIYSKQSFVKDQAKIYYCAMDCYINKIPFFHGKETDKMFKTTEHFHYFDLYDPNSYFIYFHFEVDDVHYEIGYYYKYYLIEIHQLITKIFFIISILLLFLVIALPLFFYSHLTTPIERLISTAKRINYGNLHIKVPITYHDEIGYLAASFNRMIGSIRKSILEREKISIYERDINLSKEILTRLLPKDTPQYKNLFIKTLYIPKNSIGGDIYDIKPINSTKVGFYLIDVCGSGIPAALIAGIVKSAFDFDIQYEIPSKILSMVNLRLCNILKGEYIAAGVLIIDLESSELSYSSAGLYPLLIYNYDKCSLSSLSGDGLLLGVDPDSKYIDCKYELSNKERILLYSDGITEIRGQNGYLFGEDRLKTFFHANSDMLLEHFLDKLVQEIYFWKGIPLFSKSLSDDLTVIAIDWNKTF